VNSTPGRGTTFTVYLPHVDAPLTPAAPPPPPRVRLTPGTETILLVEDQPDVRGFMRDDLSERGYRVVAAGRPAEALGLVSTMSDPIDLLITDVVMPGMSGLALAAELRAKRHDLKVLLMTGHSQETVAGLGASHGAALLQKPFTPRVLAERIREILSS